jgi:hypothetical protein
MAKDTIAMRGRWKKQMKAGNKMILILLFTLALIFPAAPGMGQGKEGGSSQEGTSKKGLIEQIEKKAKEEKKEVKKNIQKAGQELKEAGEEFPDKAVKEFKKIGRAVKETGKELKENIREAYEALKKLFKK